MPSLIDKLLFITDRCQSEPAGYSSQASQMTANALFYCTYNVKSAPPLVDCGALGKMVNITKNLDKDSNTPLGGKIYCRIFVRDQPFNFQGKPKSMQSVTEPLQSLYLCWPNYTIILIQLCHMNLFTHCLRQSKITCNLQHSTLSETTNHGV